MVEIYVDADACPVKDEVIRVAERHGVVVHVVGNSWMRLAEGPKVRRVVVPQGPDVADNWIAERVGPGDIAVTADIELAARCLAAGGEAIGPTGRPFTDIGMAVALRDLGRHLRETGESKGIAPTFTRKDRLRFLDALERRVQALRRADG